jgi:hypothetical protein
MLPCRVSEQLSSDYTHEAQHFMVSLCSTSPLAPQLQFQHHHPHSKPRCSHLHFAMLVSARAIHIFEYSFPNWTGLQVRGGDTKGSAVHHTRTADAHREPCTATMSATSV